VNVPPRGPRDEQPDEPGWWLASDGKWYPPEAAPQAAAQPGPPAVPAPVAGTPSAPATSPAPYLLTIGDIGVTPDLVVTPNGHAPLAGSQWITMDMSRTEKRIPTSAIILAIVFAIFCLLGLLFLLMREETTVGYVEVSVRSGDLAHRTQLPVSSPTDVARIRQLVAQAQSMAAQAK
jgi:hypothetical protein